jgi:hypothetical protein
MRIFLFTIFILVTSCINILSQWSTDPNNNLIVATGWDPQIVSDSAGGCYITYNYGSFYPQKLAVEKLDIYGYKPWGEKKQILGELPEQWQAEILEDGEGGVIISYEDNQVVGTDFTSRVRVQKINSNGNFLWGQTGVRVTTEETNHGLINLVSDADGGCVILWQDYEGKYWMNHIDNIGQRVWSDTGRFIGMGQSSEIIRASDGKYYVQVGTIVFRINQNGEIINQYSTTLWNILPDPEGGVELSGTVGNINNLRLVAQRKDSLGNNLWQEPYVEIADSLYINTVLMIQKNNGYFYYGWSGKKDGVDRVAQFQALRMDGSKLFPQGSTLISNRSPLAISGIFPSDSNKMILIWGNSASLPDTTLAQMYDTLGNKLWDNNGIWNEDGIVVAHPSIGHQTYATDGNGGFIIGGTIDQFTIVSQQVNRNGYLGEIGTHINSEPIKLSETKLALNQNFPNPFNSSTIIKYQIPDEGNIKISIYNILGERLRILSNEYKPAGSYALTFNSNELPSGVYMYTLETGLEVIVKKLIIIK